MEPSSREDESAKRALVTGASGFVGGHLCRLLVNSGYRVTALLRPSSSDDSLRCAGGIEIYRAELADTGLPDAVCEEVDVLFHLASIAHAGEPNEHDLNRIIVEGTESIANAAKKNGVSNFIYFSSSLADEFLSKGSTSDSKYARYKKQAEDLLLSMSDENFQVAILRPVNVYGPGMKGNIAGMIRRIRGGGLPPLPSLTNTFPLVSVQDVCGAALLLAESPGSGGHIYLVSDGQEYTPNDLEAAIYEALGRKKPGWHTPRVVFYAASLGAQIANNLGFWNNDLGLRTYRNLTGQGMGPVPSNEKISAELGFQPRRTFQSELPAILAAL